MTSVLHTALPEQGPCGSYADWDTVWKNGKSRFDSRHRGDYCLLHGVHTAIGAHPAYFPLLTAGHILREELHLVPAGHSLPSSAEVKHAWKDTHTSPHIFMVWFLTERRDKYNAILRRDR
jgi:hypothetical protein